MDLKKVSSFSDRLKEALEGKSSTELAETIGLSKQAISAYTTGNRNPKRPTVEIIARELNVNPAWLLGYDVPKLIEKPTTFTDDELLERIGNDPTKLMLARWICNLNEEQLDLVVRLLEAARLSPDE